MPINPSIYSYITEEESRADTEEVQVYNNFSWNLKNHVQMCLQLLGGYFVQGENNWLRPFKKVIEPIHNLKKTAQDIEVKDISLYVEENNARALSFLIKKYHDQVYLKEHNLDAFIDELSDEDIDVGGVLVQKGKDCPEVMPLQYIAFCDQTDIMGGPIGFKYYFGPEKLRSMSELGWGEKSNGASISLEELITLAQPEKDPTGQSGQKKNKVTGKQIEVYIVRGALPEHYLKDNDNMEDWHNQLHIVAYYRDKKNNKIGVTLYRKEEDEGAIKFHTSLPMRGRALGRGADSLFNEQIWTNFLEIHKMKMLESGAKNPLWTDDPTFGSKEKISEQENLEINHLEKGSQIGLIPTVNPVNVQLYERSINEWFEQAQLTGSAPSTLFGKQDYSGQTFRGQERLAVEGKGPHERARGKRAKFLEEIYRDWIIPDIAKEITKGKKFLATLSADEMLWVSEQIAECLAYREQTNDILDGNIPQPKEVLIQKYKESFTKKGNKRLLEILKGEFKDIGIKIDINIAGKQKNLIALTDKIFSIFQFAFANPQGFQQVMQIPGMSKSFNDILEFSGLNPVDFAGLSTMNLTPPMQPQSLQASQQMPQMLPTKATV